MEFGKSVECDQEDNNDPSREVEAENFVGTSSSSSSTAKEENAMIASTSSETPKTSKDFQGRFSSSKKRVKPVTKSEKN